MTTTLSAADSEYVKETPLDRDFVDLVASDIRGELKNRAKIAWLRSDEMFDRRYAALIALKRDLETQLAYWRGRAAQMQADLASDPNGRVKWLQWKAENSEWRSRAIGFLNAIEDHISAAKEQRRDHHRKRHGTRNTEFWNELADAIMDHKEHIDPDEASDVDKRLWELGREAKRHLEH